MKVKELKAMLAGVDDEDGVLVAGQGNEVDMSQVTGVWMRSSDGLFILVMQDQICTANENK